MECALRRAFTERSRSARTTLARPTNQHKFQKGLWHAFSQPSQAYDLHDCPAASPGRSSDRPAFPEPLLRRSPPRLLKMRWMGIEFQQRQREYQAWQEQERRSVPIYYARLNAAVVGFHKHISKDNRYLTVNCSICRTYLQEIRSYSMKIEKAMR